MRIIKAARGRITGHFGDTGVPGAHVPAHLGMDLGHGDMTPADLRVGAPAPGVITAAGWQGTYGNRIVIDHGGGYESVLAHLSEFVRTGGGVNTDTEIAVMGGTGGDWPVHLHQELRYNGVPVNPEDYLTGTAGQDHPPIYNNKRRKIMGAFFRISEGEGTGTIYWQEKPNTVLVPLSFDTWTGYAAQGNVAVDIAAGNIQGLIQQFGQAAHPAA